MRSTDCSALLLLTLLSACGRHPAAEGARAVHVPGALCDRRLLSVQDLAGILIADIVSQRAIPGDAQSCQYGTVGFPAITVSARPGAGRATVEAWTQGRMPLPVSPVSDIGESAVWQDGLHELIAQQNDLLCDVQIGGAASDIKTLPRDLPHAAAELCQKIFSRF